MMKFLRVLLLLPTRQRGKIVNVLLILLLVVSTSIVNGQDEAQEEDQTATTTSTTTAVSTTTTTTTKSCPAFRFWDENNPDRVQYGAPNGCRCSNGMSELNCGYCNDDDSCRGAESSSSSTCRQSFRLDSTIQTYVGYKCRLLRNSNNQRLASTLFGTNGKVSFYLDSLTNTTTFSLFDTRNVNEDNRTLDCWLDGCNFFDQQQNGGNTTCETIRCNCSSATTGGDGNASSESFCHPWIEQIISDENYLAGKPAEIRILESESSSTTTTTSSGSGVVTVLVDGSPFVEATCTARACTASASSDSGTSTNSNGGGDDGLGGRDDESTAAEDDDDEQDGKKNDDDDNKSGGISAQSLSVIILILFGGMLVVVFAFALVPLLVAGRSHRQQQPQEEERGGGAVSDHSQEEHAKQAATNNANNNNNNKGKRTVLKFQNLTRTIQVKGTSSSSDRTGEKTILDNVSGSVESGTMLGIMGPSGSGKTSLLNVLAAVETSKRSNKAKVSGHISLTTTNALPQNRSNTLGGGEEQPIMNNGSGYRRSVAYVHQDDALFGTLTVLECIEYSAFLRLPTTMAVQEKQALVWKTLQELQLVEIANNRIGTTGHASVSGGQRKRVSVGMELVAKPKVLCLDEPTSGLDSSAASKILKLLSDLASNDNRIVILSIHQPSIKSFLIMDRILLLGNGGRVVYNGRPSDVESYLEGRGLVCPDDETVPDYMLNVVSDEALLNKLLSLKDYEATTTTSAVAKTEEQDSNGAQQEVQELQQQHQVVVDTAADSSDCNGDDDKEEEESDSSNNPSSSGSSVWNETQTLFVRTARITFRNLELFVMQVAISIIVAFFVGAIFNDVSNDLAGFQNRMGAFYFSLSFFGFASFSSMDIFVKERHIFERETASKMYRPFSYFVAKTVLDIFVLRVVPVTIFSFILYFLMGLNPSYEKFVVYWATMILFNVCAGIISISIGIAASTVGQANLIAVVWFLIMLLFGGFLINIDSMADWFSWLKYLSIYYYAFEILITNELDGLLLKFDAPGFPTVPVWGETFVETLGMDVDNQVRNLLCLCCLATGFAFLAYLFLLLRVPPSATTYFQKMQAENDTGRRAAGGGGMTPPPPQMQQTARMSSTSTGGVAGGGGAPLPPGPQDTCEA